MNPRPRPGRIAALALALVAGGLGLASRAPAAPAPAAAAARPPDTGTFRFSPAARRLVAFRRLHHDPAVSAGPAAPVSVARGAGGVPLRHPVVLAHGAVWTGALGPDVFQGDYWQGVLQRFWDLGIPCIAPGVPPAGSIQERAVFLKKAIDEAFPEGKVHIIAHSMGGLDSRFMITMLGMGHRVKTLTTLSTPHQGSWYADFAHKFILKGQGLEHVARRFKWNFRALNDLSVRHIQGNFNPMVTDHPDVEYFSYAGVTNMWNLPLPEWGAKLVMTVAERAALGKRVGRATKAALNRAIPGAYDRALDLLHPAAESLDWIDPEVAGESDGVVSISSARWGTYLGEVRAGHLAQIGAKRSVDHVAIWETMVRRLSAMGY